MAAERKSPRGPAPPCLHAPAGGGRAGRGRATRGAVRVRPRNGPCRPARWVQCVRPDPRARWRGLETRACLGDVRDVACRGRASRYCLSCWRAWREAQCVDPCAVVPGVLPSCVRLTRPPDPARPPPSAARGKSPSARSKSPAPASRTPVTPQALLLARSRRVAREKKMLVAAEESVRCCPRQGEKGHLLTPKTRGSRPARQLPKR